LERSYRVIAGLIEPTAQGSVMIKIAITQAAFEAIARTLPLGSVSYENKANERGERLIWLDSFVVDRLRFLRGPGESYSDVILRLVETGRG
jgi:hypothetical protein